MHIEAKVKTVKDNLVFDRYASETLILQTNDEHLHKCTNLSLMQISANRILFLRYKPAFNGLKIHCYLNSREVLKC